MSLRTKLVIEGDASGAQKASQDAQRAMGEMQRRQREQGNAMRGAARETGVLKAANDNLATSFRNAAGSMAIMHGPLGGVASRLSATATLMSRAGRAGGVLAASIGAATIAAQRGVRAFTDYERQQLTTEQVINATGMAAGRTAEDIERLSREIGLGTLAATSEVRQAAGQLLTFRSIAGETFDQTLRLSQDLAAVGFGSITSAAVQLARALENPEQGLNALNRAGITFSNTQREQIRNFMETGRVADAQRLILAQVERQVGGAGGAAAGGLAGAFDTLSEQSGRWFELVGRNVANMLGLRERLMGIAAAIGSVNDAMENAGTDNSRAAHLRQEEKDVRALLRAQREHLDFMRSSGYTDAEIEREAPGLLGAERRLRDIEAEMRGLERIRQERESLEKLERRRGVETAQREQATGLIDAEIGRLREQAEAIQRTELATLQLEAAKRAQVSLDSEAGQQIAELVRQNYELAEAKRASEVGGAITAREYEAGRQAVADLIEELDRELDILRELDPVQQEMIRHRETLRYATVEETASIREKIAAQLAEREAMAELQEQYAFQKQLLTGFISEMRRAGREGKDVWEALGDAMLNVADRMIDKMLNDMIAAMFQVNSAAGSMGGGLGGGLGGGGGLGDLIGGLIKALFGGLFGFDQGGWTGPGGKHDVAGLVHADEFVFSKDATRNLGVGNLVRMHEAAKSGRGFADGGFTGLAFAPPAIAPSAAHQGSGGGVVINLNVENHGSGSPKVRSANQEADGSFSIDLILSQVESHVAGSVLNNGPVGRTIQQTFQLQRGTR